MKKLTLPKIKLNKKQIFFICIPLAVIILLVIGFFILKGMGKLNLGNNIENNQTKEGYANDMIEDPENIYQPFEESNTKIKVYGEIGWDNEGGTVPAYSRMSKQCSTKITWDEVNTYVNEHWGEKDKDTLESEYLASKGLTYKNYYEYITAISNPEKTNLTGEATEVGNHCIISIASGFDISRTWNEEEHNFTQNPMLSAYVELPDGSLLTMNDSSTFQINVYDNEIRVVLEEGLGYFRIAEQKDGKTFAVQVGDKVYKTQGGTELYVYSVSYINRSQAFKTEFSIFADTEGYDGFQTYFNQEATERSEVYLAGIKTITGDGDIYQRGTNNKIEKSENEYRFAYYYKYTYTTESIKGGYTHDANEIPTLSSFGTYVSNDIDASLNLNTNNSSREYYDYFVRDQKALNKIGQGFEKIVKNSNGNISKMMKEYVAYYTDLGTKQLAERATTEEKDTRPCSGVWFLADSPTCGCKTGWTYIKEAKGCCPNGSTYSTNQNKCVTTTIISRCPSGTYSVGNNKCCKTGSTLSSDGTRCISSTNKSDRTPTYYPNSGTTGTSGSTGSSSGSAGGSCQAQDMEACFEMGIMKDQCPGGTAGPGFYVKNGQCCQTVKMECVD